MSLMLTNKRMYHVAVKRLYQLIYVEMGILINTDICTSFNCKYTVTQCGLKLLNQRNELLQHVKLIVVQNYETYNYYITLWNAKKYDWIQLCPEKLYLGYHLHSYDRIEIAFLALIIKYFLPSPPVLENDDYTITSIVIPLCDTFVDELDLSIIPYLKRLQRIKFQMVWGNELTLIKSKFSHCLNITCLSLQFSLLNHPEFECLIDIINLDAVTSLELFIDNVLHVVVQQLYFDWLIAHLPNLNSFLVRSNMAKNIHNVCSLIMENTLSRLVILSEDFTPSEVWEQVKKQEQTIEQLFIGRCNIDFTLNYLDRIFKVTEKDNDRRLTYESMIAGFLGDDTSRYPQLSNIIVYGCDYEISRSNSSFKVNPLNY
ncbi:uncharacterized protein SPAPADRAFT_66599 [Spathaspora passalidarum NRRL Y-27907]|uniref:Uncharacterized protein n=1 Tax=Spathaspora passalidarum (strain NRRL Y-27907 / 11-Y1) TaxID=619300 RepID=G3AN71_SPAPN|nr:uncharacterized protein SPAPADRAFT_66599 [Spathaspora passalidarum NRRL Y-27907]EGW31914.1 hypothetical protein SPAPADRAFT_66599 [Spathaspora passalidarum NRRL Y-27907]